MDMLHGDPTTDPSPPPNPPAFVLTAADIDAFLAPMIVIRPEELLPETRSTNEESKPSSS